MKEQIILRDYREKDNQALENIIRKVWKYDELAGSRTASKLAKVFLYSCLTNQTYIQVAEADGIPVGVIMGKHIKKHKGPLKYYIKQALSILSLFPSREGRQIAGMFGDISKIDKELLQKCGKDYQGEIAFFAVDPKYQGRGIGKMLYQQVMSYMERQNLKKIYLFTDTSCNFKFYESQGMKKSREHTHVFNIQQKKAEMKFYLYENE